MLAVSYCSPVCLDGHQRSKKNVGCRRIFVSTSWGLGGALGSHILKFAFFEDDTFLEDHISCHIISRQGFPLLVSHPETCPSTQSRLDPSNQRIWRKKANGTMESPSNSQCRIEVSNTFDSGVRRELKWGDKCFNKVSKLAYLCTFRGKCRKR